MAVKWKVAVATEIVGVSKEYQQHYRAHFVMSSSPCIVPQHASSVSIHRCHSAPISSSSASLASCKSRALSRMAPFVMRSWKDVPVHESQQGLVEEKFPMRIRQCAATVSCRKSRASAPQASLLSPRARKSFARRYNRGYRRWKGHIPQIRLSSGVLYIQVPIPALICSRFAPAFIAHAISEAPATLLPPLAACT